MNIIMCPRGHSYDSDVYMECPYCTNPEYMGNYGGGPMDDYQTIVGSENDYRTIFFYEGSEVFYFAQPLLVWPFLHSMNRVLVFF